MELIIVGIFAVVIAFYGFYKLLERVIEQSKQGTAVRVSLYGTLLVGAAVIYLVFYSPMKASKWCGLVNLLGMFLLIVLSFVATTDDALVALFAPLGIMVPIGPTVSLPFFLIGNSWWLDTIYIKLMYFAIIGIFLIVALVRRTNSVSSLKSKKRAAYYNGVSSSDSSSSGSDSSSYSSSYSDGKSEYQRDLERILSLSGVERMKAIDEFEEKYPWPPV